MSKPFSKEELKALAMHEIMKREQQRYQERVLKQKEISLMSDEKLQEMFKETKEEKL